MNRRTLLQCGLALGAVGLSKIFPSFSFAGTPPKKPLNSGSLPRKPRNIVSVLSPQKKFVLEISPTHFNQFHNILKKFIGEPNCSQIHRQIRFEIAQTLEKLYPEKTWAVMCEQYKEYGIDVNIYFLNKKEWKHSLLITLMPQQTDFSVLL